MFYERTCKITKRVHTSSIPVIDLFAGPGGLGEGFDSFEQGSMSPFRVVLSVEKEKSAHQTLLLRSFFRQFRKGAAPDAYYEQLRQVDIPLPERLGMLYDRYPEQAEQARSVAWQQELSGKNQGLIHERISSVIGDTKEWVLLGGPPCQAYSLIGRSRNKGKKDYNPEEDERQKLYIEYLQVIAEHAPAAFVMENVKGLLSATVQNQRIFGRIVDDIADPVEALRRVQRTLNLSKKTPIPRYVIFSLVKEGAFNDGDLRDFIVQMENYGIPQTRHRLILLGVRADVIGSKKPGVLTKVSHITAEQVLSKLPRLRSGLSKEKDSAETWLEHILNAQNRRWFKPTKDTCRTETSRHMTKMLQTMASSLSCGRGSDFVSCDPSTSYEWEWFIDSRIGGVYNHSTRGHMVKDLYRYFYAACYAKVNDRSPILSHFPANLLPEHKNVKVDGKSKYFEDRFRVQLANKPSTTVTSHIAKDGHYYIHYDPTQCRSLTVREAARLQTFPDNYFFCGPRTAQYIQVGNAVPPLLSRQVASVVSEVLKECGVIND